MSTPAHDFTETEHPFPPPPSTSPSLLASSPLLPRRVICIISSLTLVRTRSLPTVIQLLDASLTSLVVTFKFLQLQLFPYSHIIDPIYSCLTRTLVSFLILFFCSFLLCCVYIPNRILYSSNPSYLFSFTHAFISRPSPSSLPFHPHPFIYTFIPTLLLLLLLPTPTTPSQPIH